MSIRRAPRPEAHFLMVRNDVCRDDRLTYRALGLLVAMLSYPDNWTFATERLAKGEGREGEKAVRTALKELERHGYLVRHRTKTDNGRFTWEHILHDTPQVAPGADPAMPDPLDDQAPPAPADPATPEDLSGESWREQDKALFLDLIGADTVKSVEGGKWTPGTYHTLGLYGGLRKRPRNAMKWPGRYLRSVLNNEHTDYRDIDEWLDAEGIEAIHHTKENPS